MRNHVNFVTHRTGTPLTNSRHWETFAINDERRDIPRVYADKEKSTNAKNALYPKTNQKQLEENPTNQRQAYTESKKKNHRQKQIHNNNSESKRK